MHPPPALDVVGDELTLDDVAEPEAAPAMVEEPAAAPPTPDKGAAGKLFDEAIPQVLAQNTLSEMAGMATSMAVRAAGSAVTSAAQSAITGGAAGAPAAPTPAPAPAEPAPDNNDDADPDETEDTMNLDTIVTGFAGGDKPIRAPLWHFILHADRNTFDALVETRVLAEEVKALRDRLDADGR